MPTATVRMKTKDKVSQVGFVKAVQRAILDMMILTIPIQASHWILPRVRMLERPMATVAAIATKAAVHVPCSDTAFNPIEIPSMPDPATKM
jgi:hypothetical protein